LTDVAAEQADDEIGGTADEELVEVEALAVDDASRPDDDIVLDAGYQALRLVDASAVAADIDAAVILIAGPQDAGKTTLLVQIYAQFLHGPFAGFGFAGSATLDAFDRRHYLARVSSGRSTADTERTEDEDLRVLHLRLADDVGAHKALLLSDIKGEVFDDLLLGNGVADGLAQLAQRADKVALVIDGERIAELSTRQGAVFQARQLIGALSEPGRVRAETPMQIILLKRDLLNDEQLAWFEAESAKLRQFATSRGLLGVTGAAISARPKDQGLPVGLEDLLHWMVAPVDRPAVLPTRRAATGRTFATGVIA
jgi:hypothetical protein